MTDDSLSAITHTKPPERLAQGVFYCPLIRGKYVKYQNLGR